MPHGGSGVNDSHCSKRQSKRKVQCNRSKVTKDAAPYQHRDRHPQLNTTAPIQTLAFTSTASVINIPAYIVQCHIYMQLVVYNNIVRGIAIAARTRLKGLQW
jgi:hypothetical protein